MTRRLLPTLHIESRYKPEEHLPKQALEHLLSAKPAAAASRAKGEGVPSPAAEAAALCCEHTSAGSGYEGRHRKAYKRSKPHIPAAP